MSGKIKTNLVVYMLILVGFFGFIQLNIPIVSAESNPDPVIYSIENPDSIELGEWATITIRGINNGCQIATFLLSSV